MNEFLLWLKIGIAHLLDLKGYDHILFISLLVIPFSIFEWKKILVLITAFTIGHSISLFLSVSTIINPSVIVIEFLIAFSILITAVFQGIQLKNKSEKFSKWIYVLTLFFGIIHGLGFSFFLKSLLGNSLTILAPLLYFNIGLEVGQLFIVLILLLFFYAMQFNQSLLKIVKYSIILFIFIIALKMNIERFLQLV